MPDRLEKLYGTWMDGIVGGILEVEVPDPEPEEQLDFYQRYRKMGGMAIPEYEELLKIHIEELPTTR